MVSTNAFFNPICHTFHARVTGYVYHKLLIIGSIVFHMLTVRLLYTGACYV